MLLIPLSDAALYSEASEGDLCDPGNSENPAHKGCPVCDDPSGTAVVFSSLRSKINDKVQSAKEISSEKIISIGGCIDGIVKHARQYVEESKEAFDKNFSEQNHSLENYLKYSRGSIEAQSSTVKNALSLSDDISRAGEAVDKLAGEAKLLALNATIESAHLGGDQGVPLA